jgi:hypothetical protein
VTVDATEKTRRKAPRRKTRLPDEQARAKRDLASEAAAWDLACDEVVASILSDRLHKTMRIDMDPGIVAVGVRARVEEAKSELGEHRVSDVGCYCRHHALLTVGANNQSRMSGGSPGLFFDAARATFEAFLARRN